MIGPTFSSAAFSQFHVVQEGTQIRETHVLVVRFGVAQADRSAHVEEDQIGERDRRHEDEEPGSEKPHEAPLLEDVETPRAGRDLKPRTSLARRSGPALVDGDDRDDRRRKLEKSEADGRGDEIAGEEPDGCDRDAPDATEHDHHAHESARETHLRSGHEVRDVALEWPLGEVG